MKEGLLSPLGLVFHLGLPASSPVISLSPLQLLGHCCGFWSRESFSQLLGWYPPYSTQWPP